MTKPRVLAVALALALLWPAFVTAKNGLSGLYARPAIDYLQDKRFDSYVVTQAQWEAVHESVRQAARLMPDNPQYQSTLGWLEQLKLTLFADELGPHQIDTHARAAAVYFRRAIDSRPTSSHYWGNLALEYHRAGDVESAQYSAALANAAQFGPWKNDIQRLVADLGVERFVALTPRARHEVLLTVERALHRQPQIILEIVGNLGGWSALCAAHSERGRIDPALQMASSHTQALCLRLQTRGAGSK